jgi:hypothetical protein
VPIDVDAVLTEHRLRRNRHGNGRLLKQEIDCALLRGHTLNLTDDRRRGRRTDHSERTATFGSTRAGAELPFMVVRGLMNECRKLGMRKGFANDDFWVLGFVLQRQF